MKAWLQYVGLVLLLALVFLLLSGCRAVRFINDGQLPAEHMRQLMPTDTVQHSPRPLWLSPYRPSNYLPPIKHNIL